MKKLRIFLRVFFCVFAVTFANDAFAAKVTCSAGTYWNGSACTTCTATYYCTGFTRNNPAVNYGRTLCPTGYRSGDTGLTARNQCPIQTTDGTYIATAYSTIKTTCTAGYYCTAALITYGSTGNRTQCTGATYSASGASSCTDCPDGYTANTTSGKTAITQCQIQATAGNYIATANDTSMTTCPSGYYCPAALISYGSTGTRNTCPTNYDDGGTGLSAQNQCKLQTTAGSYIATANSSTQSSCSYGYYCPAALINYGSTGSRISCPSGYTDGDMGASSQDQCQMWTYDGEYVANAYDTTATTCPAGSYCVSEYINYGSTGSITQCTGATWSGTGASSCTTCPGSYTANTTAGKTAQNQCQIQTAGGTYIATANSSTQTTCTATYYCPAALINYGSTGTRTLCPASYRSGGTGLTVQSDCKFQTTAGQYIATANATTQTACTAGSYCPAALVGYGSIGSITQCTGATYSGAGASSCTTCPGSYTANTTAGKTAQNQCQIQTAGGTYIAAANSSTQTTCPATYYCPVALINYGSTGTRTSCPTNYVNGGTGLSTQNQCALQTTAGQYIATANSSTQTTCTAGSYCPAALITYGSTGSITQCTGATYSGSGASSCTTCPGSYTANTDAGKTANTQCQIQTTAGQYIATANSSTQTNCTAGSYCPVALINYGSTGSISQCLGGTYSTSGATACTECVVGSYSATGASACIACQNGTTTASSGMTSCGTACSNDGVYDTSWVTATWNTNNTVTNLCSINGCSGGYYISGGQCTEVGSGYWSANNSSTRTACTSGLTTIGYGAGADEVGDCGKVFNVSGSKVYLRSVKKTSPSLFIQLSGSTYYGNMTTDNKGLLKANYGGTNYSIVDDSM
ncbi:MAG TPA: hypothetical protein PKJ33_02050 [Alphaproteobacteria bacterium]|nr:hypothetical protein [Alphaproteobacteria bacterium]